MNDDSQDWHLDKRIPIITMFGLFVQILAAVWFFAQLSSDVAENTKNIDRVEWATEARMVRHERESADRNGRILDALQRIEDKIDKKADK